jgi:hypothetical protein
MRIRLWIAGFLGLCAPLAQSGCVSASGPAAQPSVSAGTVSARRVTPAGPLEVAGLPANRVWEEVVEVVDRHFDIQDQSHNETGGESLSTRRATDPGSAISGTLPDGPPNDAFDPALTDRTATRRAFVDMERSGNGYQLYVNVFREEANDLIPPRLPDWEPNGSAIGPDSFDIERERQSWHPAGRDEQMESGLLAEVQNELLNVPTCTPRERFIAEIQDLPHDIWQDYKNFYSRDSLTLFGIALGGAAISANTTIDSKFDAWFQGHVRTGSTDGFIGGIKWLGDGGKTIPIILGVTVLTGLTDSIPGGEAAHDWGMRSIRAFAVGVPPMLAFQEILGSARPGQSPNGSHWTPFKTPHGVSGDAFMASVPFVTAAMMAENVWLKSAFYVCSTLPAIGRINDHDHYLSQAALGWFMGYLSVRAVTLTESERESWSVSPTYINGGMGAAMEYRH